MDEEFIVPELSRSARRAAEVIRYTPGVTRIDLAQTLGISAPTVNPLVAALVGAGLVEEREAPRTAGAKGRPRTGLVHIGRRDTVGVIAWSHGVFDVALMTFANEVAWRRKTVVGSEPRTEEDLVAAAYEIFTAADQNPGLRTPSALVLALPAPYESGVGVAGRIGDGGSASFAGWFEGDPMTVLSARFDTPVIVENDANLGALGETTVGASAGLTCAIYCKLSGHGIGSGITIAGEVFEGSNGFAGEIAHVRVDDDSRIICACGNRGCLEEKLGPNLLQPFQETYGSDLTWADLLEMVDSDAPGPLRVLEDAGRVVGRALADMSTYFNPAAIVFDAGTPKASEVVLRGVREQIDQSAPPFIRHHLQLRITELGDDAALLGSVQIARLLHTRSPMPGQRQLRVYRAESVS